MGTGQRVYCHITHDVKIVVYCICYIIKVMVFYINHFSLIIFYY